MASNRSTWSSSSLLNAAWISRSEGPRSRRAPTSSTCSDTGEGQPGSRLFLVGMEAYRCLGALGLDLVRIPGAGAYQLVGDRARVFEARWAAKEFDRQYLIRADIAQPY